MKRLEKEELIGNNQISSSKKFINGLHTPHFHDFYEIEYVVHGGGNCILNDENIPFTDGMLFFVTPVDFHSVQTDGAEIFNIMFSEHLVGFRQLEIFLDQSAPKAFKIAPQDRQFVEQILAEITANENSKDYSAALMNCLLLKLTKLLPERKKNHLSDRMSKIRYYIINNYRNKITLETVASYAGLTPSYVSALFKKEMHMGLKVYVNTLRLEYAQKLLIYTEQPIKQICEESGFDDVPNFMKRFKAYYGITPSTLRRKHVLQE